MTRAAGELAPAVVGEAEASTDSVGMTAFPAHDAGNVISNVDGIYLQALTSRAANYAATTVASVTPSTIPQSAATAVSISGTGFRSGLAVSVSGTGVTVSATAVVNATTITATLTATAGATLSARAVTVTNASATDVYDADTKAAAFTVVAP